MPINNERKLVALKRCEDPPYLNRLDRHPSPTRQKMTINRESHIGDAVNKLDKQVADLKRKQKNGFSMGSPKKRSSSLHSLLNPSQLLGDGHGTSFSMGTKYVSDKSLNSLEPANATVAMRSRSDLPCSSIYDTHQNIPKLAPKKTGTINMFDLIPSRDTVENEMFVEVFDSSQSQNDESGSRSSYKEEAQDHEHLFSSPIKRVLSTPKQKKQVAFSSDIESSSVTSSPIKRSNGEPRSILKTGNSDSPFSSIVTLDEILERDLSKNESWPPGFVLQIPVDHPYLIKSVTEFTKGLNDCSFTKQYEVYATFNHLIKSNPKIINNRNIFTKCILKSIVISVEKGLLILLKELKDRTNAFKLRSSSQGLKLLALLNTLVDEISAMSNIYDIVVKLLKNENISKGLVLSIFHLLKILPEAYYKKMESVTIALIQTKYFTSSTVTTEKLHILKRFILLQPSLLSRCSYQILNHVLFSILNTNVPGYNKILLVSVSILTCIAKNEESKIVADQLLLEEVDRTSTFLNTQDEDQCQPRTTNGQALCETLKFLVSSGLYVQAAKIWAYMLYMVCFNRKTFLVEKWNVYPYFEDVFKKLYFNKNGCLFALEAWKTVVYNFQIVSIRSLTNEQLKERLNFLLLPFEKLQLEINNDTIKQWSEHAGYIVLYCRIYYAIRLQMDATTNETQLNMLLDSMFKPLLQLKKWDHIYSYFLEIMFVSDRYVYNETAVSCFWLSDLEKWKSKVMPLPKLIFKSKIFETVFNIAENLSHTSLDIGTKFTEICIYSTLDNHKLSFLSTDSAKLLEMTSGLILNLVSFHMNKVTESKEIFNIISKVNTDFLFSKIGNNEMYLMTQIFDNFSETKNIQFLVEFLQLCHGKIGLNRFYFCCITSKFYSKLDSRLGIDTFLLENIGQFLPYVRNLNTIVAEHQISVSELEQDNILKNFEKMINGVRGEEPEDSYELIITVLKQSDLFEILSLNSKFELFSMLLDVSRRLLLDMKTFYHITPTKFLEDALMIFDNTNDSIANGIKLIALLKRFQDAEFMSDEWISCIGNKLVYIVYPELKIDEMFFKFMKFLESRLSLNIVNKIKKLAIRRKMNDFPFLRSQYKVDIEGIDDTIHVDDDSTECEDENTQVISAKRTFCVERMESSEIELSEIHVSRSSSDEAAEKPIPVEDLKSFIIDSIKIDKIEEPTVRIPSNSEEIQTDEDPGASPARRTRSHSDISDMGTLDEWNLRRKMMKKERKKERRERKERRRRSRSHSVEKDETDAETEAEVEVETSESSNGATGGLDSDIFRDDSSTTGAQSDFCSDMDQFQKLLAKLNRVPISISKEEKEMLETGLVTLLMKLKQT